MADSFMQETLTNCLEKVIDYRGKTPKKLGGEWSDSGYRAISADNVKTFGLSAQDSIRFVDEVLYKKWMKEEVQKGDILLTSEAPAGQVMVWNSSEKIVLSQRVYCLRVGDKLDPWYLKYYLQSSTGQREIFRNNSGSTVFGISAETFKNILVRYPRKEIQTKIGDFLAALDFKIETNLQINAKLAAISQTLHDYWFVQFDFPDKSNRPYKSSGGKLVYNHPLKRSIPAGWDIKALSEISTIVMGQSPKGDSYNSEQKGLPLVNGAADYKYSLLMPETYTTAPTRVCKKDDMVFCIRATIGNLTFADKTFCLGRCVAAVRPNETFRTEQIYFRLLQEMERFKAHSSGSIILGITKDDLRNSLIPLPPEDLSKEFHTIISPLFAQIRVKNQENQRLAELRDWLLPMLMNGQVTVQ